MAISFTQMYESHLKQGHWLYILPEMYRLGKECSHITEFGVQHGWSTTAWLAAGPKKVIGYDMVRCKEVDEFERLSNDNTKFVFRNQNTLKSIIEETDLLFIDTVHTCSHVLRELKVTEGKVKKYLVFHDVTHPKCGAGVREGIKGYLSNHPEWQRYRHIEENQGLEVLKRNA